MKFSISSPLILASALPVYSSILVAEPVAYSKVTVPQVLNHVGGTYPGAFNSLAPRNGPQSLGNFSLATQISDKILFSFQGQIAQGTNSVAAAISAKCISCISTGYVLVSTTGFTPNGNLLDDIIGATKKLFSDPEGFITEALDATMDVNFQGITGHFEFDIAFQVAGSYTVPLFKSETPIGVQIDGNDVGVTFQANLIFTASSAVDFTTGFDVIWPSGTGFVLDILKGEILSQNFAGVHVSGIPFKFKQGNACITVSLRYVVQVGATINILGTGVSVQSGVFMDAPSFKSCVTYSPASTCQLAFNQTFIGDAAAFATAGIAVASKTLKAGPTILTTLWTGALPGTCLATKVAPTSSPTVIATAVRAPVQPLVAQNTTLIRSSSPAFPTASKMTSVTVLANAGGAVQTPTRQLSNNTALPPTFATGTAPAGAVVSPGVYTYTITGCAEPLHWCPSSMQEPHVLTSSTPVTPAGVTPSAALAVTSAEQQSNYATAMVTNAAAVSMYIMPEYEVIETAMVGNITIVKPATATSTVSSSVLTKGVNPITIAALSQSAARNWTA